MWDRILGVSADTVESIPQNVRSVVEEQLAPLRTADISDESDDYTEEEEAYLCRSIAIVLNKLSQHCAKANPSSGKEPANYAVIYHVLRRHSTENKASKRPDIVAKYGTVDDLNEYLQYLCHTTAGDSSHQPKHYPLPHCIAAVTVRNSDFDESYRTEVKHLESIQRDSPQSHVVYGLSARRVGYILYKLTPFDLETTDEMGWDDDEYKPLLAFTQAVLTAREGWDGRLNPIVNKKQQWSISMQIDGNPELLKLLPLYCSSPPGPTTWIGAGFGMASFDVRVLKVVWVDDEQIVSEEAMYKLAHGEQPIPGLVRVLSAEVLDQRSLYASNNDGNTQTKKALLLDDLGQPLSQIASLVEFLKVIYDTFESK
jgi:hypothetical protein